MVFVSLIVNYKMLLFFNKILPKEDGHNMMIHKISLTTFNFVS